SGLRQLARGCLRRYRSRRSNGSRFISFGEEVVPRFDKSPRSSLPLLVGFLVCEAVGPCGAQVELHAKRSHYFQVLLARGVWGGRQQSTHNSGDRFASQPLLDTADERLLTVLLQYGDD